MSLPQGGALNQGDSRGGRDTEDNGDGVLVLFPRGGAVFPVGTKTRFRLDLLSMEASRSGDERTLR